jgi:tRNA A-37 threonylcarbamoyl transferase component Bud32
METVCPACATGQQHDAEVCPKDGTPLVPRGGDSDPFIGLEIDGRLRVDRFLGSGGMGHVYVATQLDATRRLVAVKFIRSELLGSDADEKRFFREVQMLASGAHASVVSVHFAGKTQLAGRQIPYFAMELIAGAPLSDRVGRGRRLGQEHVARLGVNILKGLVALHAQGLVHRDLKPANVLLLDGSDDEIKILDFGLAKPVQRDEALQITASNVVLGTPDYMSPEQMLGWELDGRSDLFSIGVMLYEMLSGKRPVKDRDGRNPRLDKAHPGLDIDASLCDFVASLLESGRAARPASAAVALASLMAISERLSPRTNDFAQMALEPTSTAPAAPSEPPAGEARVTPRPGFLFAALSVGLLLLAAAVYFFASRPDETRRAAGSAPDVEAAVEPEVTGGAPVGPDVVAQPGLVPPDAFQPDAPPPVDAAERSDLPPVPQAMGGAGFDAAVPASRAADAVAQTGVDAVPVEAADVKGTAGPERAAAQHRDEKAGPPAENGRKVKTEAAAADTVKERGKAAPDGAVVTAGGEAAQPTPEAGEESVEETPVEAVEPPAIEPAAPAEDPESSILESE